MSYHDERRRLERAREDAECARRRAEGRANDAAASANRAHREADARAWNAQHEAAREVDEAQGELECERERLAALEHDLAAEQGRSLARLWLLRDAVVCYMAARDACHFSRRCSAAWKRLAKRERETRRKLQSTAFCMWCGHVHERTEGAIRDHLTRCAEHPMRAIVRNLAAERDARKLAEQQRDEARRSLALSMAGIFKPDAHNWAAERWGAVEAERLFPVEGK